MVVVDMSVDNSEHDAFKFSVNRNVNVAIISVFET